MGRVTYWKSSARELDSYIREVWMLLKRERCEKWVSNHALALFVSDKLTEAWWYSEELRERFGMAKRESKDVAWQGFVDVKLTSEEKENYMAWDVHDEDLWVLLVDAIGCGHKLSVTYNKQNDQFVASFTGQTGTEGNEGYTLSAYGKVWYDAVRVLCYKHAVLLDCDWLRAKERVSDNIG